MTDDEINKAIGEVTAILPDSRDRTIYCAGMLRAAHIALEFASKFAEPVCEQAALRVADAIERAASGEQKGGTE
jgi:hypothetical protein